MEDTTRLHAGSLLYTALAAPGFKPRKGSTNLERGGRRLAKIAVSNVTKASFSPAEWREKFQVVYQEDQCLPGAFYAILTSADLLFEKGVTRANSMGDINRKLGYRKGFGTPADALERSGIRRVLATHGLEVHWERGLPQAFDNLVQSTASTDASFSIVEVDLELVTDYDPNARIRGPPFAADHAIVVLGVTDGEVEFFDPTFNPSLPGNQGTRQVLSTPLFIRRWSGCKEPYYRVWVTRMTPLAAPRTARERLRGVVPLSKWRQKGKGLANDG